MSPARGFAIGLLAVFAVPGICIGLMFAWDMYLDRQRTIEFEEPTRLLVGASDGQCDESRLQAVAIIRPGDKFEVRRVRYWKNCMTVEVRSKDHKLRGFVISGPTFHLSEPR